MDLRLRQTGGNTQALGALVKVVVGGRARVAQVGAGPSYLSQNSETLHFGLGSATRADRVEVRWPDGVTETYTDLPADQCVDLEHEAHYDGLSHTPARGAVAH